MPSRISSEVLVVRHEFSTDEKLVIAGELAAAYSLQQGLAEEKKSAAAQFKERESALEAKVGSLSRSYQTGFEMQNVKCRLVWDEPNVGEVSYYDPEGKLVKTRAMTDSERQLELQLDQGEKTDEEAQRSVEQSEKNVNKFFPGNKNKSDKQSADDPEGQCKNCELWFPASVLKTTEVDFHELCPKCWEECVEEPKRQAEQQAGPGDQQAENSASPAPPDAPGATGDEKKDDDKPEGDLDF